jgi:hypothetical protein
MGDEDIFIVLGSSPEDIDRVTSMWVLEYLLLRGTGGGGAEPSHLATRTIDSISKNPKTLPLMLAELCKHPSEQVSAQAMNTLIWLTNRNEKGARKKSVEEFARMVDGLREAPDAEERARESEDFLRGKGMVIGAEALDKLDIFALEMFEELLPRDMMLEVKRAVASHPETPDGLLEVLTGDPDGTVREAAARNIREARRDLEGAPSEEESARLTELYQGELEGLARDIERKRVKEVRGRLHGGLSVYLGMLDVADAYCKSSIGAKPANAMIAAYGELHGRLEGTKGTEELSRRMGRANEFADGVNPEIKRLHRNLSRNVADVELILIDRRRSEETAEIRRAASACARKEAEPEKRRV